MRLTAKHPTHRKLENLFQLIDGAGISFTVDCGNIIVKCDGVSYDLKDIDPHHEVYDIPPRMEWKLVTGENDD